MRQNRLKSSTSLGAYAATKSTRIENRTIVGRAKGGRLDPIMMVQLRPNEGGVFSYDLAVLSDQLGGRLLTDIGLDVKAVFVPTGAIREFDNPNDPYAGSPEVLRDLLEDETPLFGYTLPSDISKKAAILPKKIGGTKKLDRASWLAHNSAVNFLRRRLYHKAAQLTEADGPNITPALLSQTVLDRFNAVLDPEDRINGAVTLSGELPVKGLGTKNHGSNPSQTGGETGGTQTGGGWTVHSEGGGSTQREGGVSLVVEKDPDAMRPNIRASFDGSGQQLSLKDFYRAETQDRLIRQFDDILKEYPQHGEEMISRFVHGLSVDLVNEPVVLVDREIRLQNNTAQAMDGANLGEVITRPAGGMSFDFVVPRTEFGGMVIVFMSIKPDETLATQPHPIMSEPFVGHNHAADEFAVDPVPVLFRDLDMDVDTADEDKVAFYVGNNHFERIYSHYGFALDVDQTEVANKNSIWQLQVPMSVTPDSVIYPETIDQYPWQVQTGNIVTYTVSQQARIASPYKLGPTPIEDMAFVDSDQDDIFNEA